MLFPPIDKTSWFYKNCKKQRKNNAKICQVCPFRLGIETMEVDSSIKNSKTEKENRNENRQK